MAKGAEGDGGVADIGLVGEHDLQDGHVTNNRCCNGGYEKQNRCYEEQEGADMMEDACLCHCDCVWLSRIDVLVGRGTKWFGRGVNTRGIEGF